MKRIPTLCLLIPLVLLACSPGSSLPDGSQATSQANQQASPSQEETMWVITDLHYLSPQLHDQGQAFQRMQNTAAGKDLIYSKERMEALVYQVTKEKPDLLVVSGDLTFNGEYQSGQELADYFHQIEKLGTQVYLIPGNHDLSNGWARSFQGDQSERIQQILPKDFQSLFGDFGLLEATSRDSHSLSYLAKPYADYWLLMLDSNIYTTSEGLGGPKTPGQIKEETLAWIEQALKEAKDQGAKVIPVVHHNTLSHHGVSSKDFLLPQGQDLLALYQSYGVSLGFSGHIHSQSISSQGFTEIVNGAFSVYPSVIGQVSLSPQELTYHKTQLDMDLWAKDTQQTNPDLVDHQAYQKELFLLNTEIFVAQRMFDEQWYQGDLSDQIAAWMSPLQVAFFAGESLDLDQVQAQLDQEASYQVLIQDHPDSRLVSYLDRLLKNGQENHETFSLTY